MPRALKAMRTKRNFPLTQTPVGVKYLAQGSAELYINKPFANGSPLLAHSGTCITDL